MTLTPLIQRLHHQAIAQVLYALDGAMLKENDCLFGGGTVMALRFGEYRESVDIDFLVSSVNGYSHLRQLATQDISDLFQNGAMPFQQTGDVRADRYGIRTMLSVMGSVIKFEIILEGRIELEPPKPEDEVYGIATLTPLDMATSKLLANSDRWADDGIFNRDLIDLAMMCPAKPLLVSAVAKAQRPYGNSVIRDLAAAMDRVQNRQGWLERCMQAMAMEIPKALLWQRIRALRKVL